MKLLKTMKWSHLISGILFALLGIVTLFTPLYNVAWLAAIISIALLVSGIAELINYFTTNKAERSGWLLAEAILSTLIGVWMVFGSGSWVLSSILPYIFALFVFASGIVHVVESFQLKAAGGHMWGWLLAFGIICAVLGGFMFFSPLFSASFIGVMLSLLFIGHGISNIAMYANMQRAGNYIRGRLRGED